MNNKTETATGILTKQAGVWEFHSGYGKWHLAPALQDKPADSAEGAHATATIIHGIVTDYHFSEPFTDKP